MDVATIWTEIGHNLDSAGISALPKLAPLSGSPALHISSHALPGRFRGLT